MKLHQKVRNPTLLNQKELLLIHHLPMKEFLLSMVQEQTMKQN